MLYYDIAYRLDVPVPRHLALQVLRPPAGQLCKTRELATYC